MSIEGWVAVGTVVPLHEILVRAKDLSSGEHLPYV